MKPNLNMLRILHTQRQAVANLFAADDDLRRLLPAVMRVVAARDPEYIDKSDPVTARHVRDFFLGALDAKIELAWGKYLDEVRKDTKVNWDIRAA